MQFEQAKRTIGFVSGLLTCLGIFYIASASSYWSAVHYPNSLPFWIKQSIFAVLAIVLFKVVQLIKLDYRTVVFLYFAGLLVALTVWLPGLGVVRNGARGWITLAGFYFQPAELTKVTTLLFLSHLLSFKTPLIKQLIVLGIPSTLFMLQPDFGSTFLLVATYCALLFVTGLSMRLILLGIVSAVLGLVALIATAPYRLKRITAFLDPWEDPLGAGFQAIQSLLAIGPAGFTGWGFGNSRQKLLYLPEPQNDFIFSLIIEESGWLMAACICFCYVLWGRSAYTLASYHLQTVYGIQIAALALLLLIQTSVNLGVVTGLLPVTGVTLPFISYGGSSLVSCWVVTGLIIAIYKQGREAEEWKN